MFSRSLLAAALAAVAVSSAAAADTSRNWQQSFRVSAHPVVNVNTNDGRIRIHTGPGGEVRAAVHFESRHWGFASGDNTPEVSLTQDGDVVNVLARARGGWVMMGAVSRRLEIDVTVPATCDLVVKSGDGSITVEQPVAGRLDLESGDGRIMVHGGQGAFVLRTADGGILADLLDGSLRAHSGDGRIEISGRFDRLDIESGDGRVDATALAGSKLAEGWSLRTSDGSLAVRIPRALQAELDARTSDGRIHFELPVQVSGLDRRRIHGLINGGGPPLRLRTGDGSITLAVSD